MISSMKTMFIHMFRVKYVKKVGTKIRLGFHLKPKHCFYSVRFVAYPLHASVKYVRFPNMSLMIS